MGVVMDLVAGDAREILLAIGVEDWQGLRDPTRFAAYLPLGGRMDPAWLDLFARAVREATGNEAPASFTEACCPLESRSLTRLRNSVDRTIERVDPHWIDDVAMIPDRALGRIAARWIELIDCQECEVEPDDKPMIRSVAGEIVSFCRNAQTAEDVLLAWTI
jgi:hypothetical protein